ncbi:MAG: sce7726 family protein [Marinobacter sp.]|uniref:sce7726 family protein n=1 Tax=Marinobacter sp. TaxID=50741 RepID=UPI00349FD800
MSSTKILEPQMKATTINYLIEKGQLTSKDTIINEFTIGDFSRRVDLAVVAKNRLYAFEIKSESDTLSRLEGQIAKYLEYFDKVTIVAATKHIPKILRIAPKNVAIWEQKNNKVIVHQRGKIIEIMSQELLLAFMRTSDLSRIAKDLGVYNSNRSEIIYSLRELPVKKIRKTAIKSLQSKFELTNALFWQKAEGIVKIDDLKRLSPYIEWFKRNIDPYHSGSNELVIDLIFQGKVPILETHEDKPTTSSLNQSSQSSSVSS